MASAAAVKPLIVSNGALEDFLNDLGLNETATNKKGPKPLTVSVLTLLGPHSALIHSINVFTKSAEPRRQCG